MKAPITKHQDDLKSLVPKDAPWRHKFAADCVKNVLPSGNILPSGAPAPPWAGAAAAVTAAYAGAADVDDALDRLKNGMVNWIAATHEKDVGHGPVSAAAATDVLIECLALQKAKSKPDEIEWQLKRLSHYTGDVKR